METSSIGPIIAKLSIVLTVVSIGLKTRPSDVTGLWRRPGLLTRSLFVLNVLVPAAVLCVVLIFDPIPPVKIALVLLAFSPIPPVLPGKQAKLSDDWSYICGLLVTASLISVVYVPFAVTRLINLLTDRSAVMPIAPVFKVILTTVIAPLATGMLVRTILPSLANKTAGPLGKVAGIMLLVSLAFILIGVWRPVVSLVGNGTVAIIALVVGMAVAAGHWLGGPDPDDRAALALAASGRHPGVAVAVAGVVFPDERAIAAAVILYLLLNGLFTLPYTMRRKRTGVALELEQRSQIRWERLQKPTP
jgi:bile acid:Na+ symporter, BASS family